MLVRTMRTGPAGQGDSLGQSIGSNRVVSCGSVKPVDQSSALQAGSYACQVKKPSPWGVTGPGERLKALFLQGGGDLTKTFAVEMVKMGVGDEDEINVG